MKSLTSAATPGDDAPELAHLGRYGVGVATITLVNKDQPDIANFNMVTRQTPRYDREISVDIFYPATVSEDAARETFRGQFFNPDERPIPGLPDSFTIASGAERNVEPVRGERFPLVIVSHGLGNTPGALIALTENLASKGYVVAAIDHRDYVPGESKSFLRLFPRAMLFRSIDQQFVLKQLTAMSSGSDGAWAGLIDATNVGLVGYSMGGYGALNVAGAGYDSAAPAFGWVGGKQLAPLSEGNGQYETREVGAVRAVVAISPWGAQDGVEIWRPQALAKIQAPLLLVVGSKDDVVGYESGVGDIFRGATGTDRYMLVFQNALHNLIQVGAPEAAYVDVAVWEAFEDPTWRKQRLLAVNQHFVTAFLDWHLKGDESRRAYLDVPTVLSNDGAWEQPPGKYYGDQFADGTNGSGGYWRGFKRRQALGLEMHRLARGSDGR